MKTVCPQGRVGSNPTLSARQVDEKKFWKNLKKYLTNSFEMRYNAQGFSMRKHRNNFMKEHESVKRVIRKDNGSRAIWRSTQAGRRGSPGKGVGR